MPIEVSSVQKRLVMGGYEIGPVDGDAGTKTWAGIFAYVAQRPLSLMLPFGEAAKVYLPRYGIADTPTTAPLTA